ncbi:MAG: putative ABC transporter permease [Oscillospiraceae bacterium]|nr:putative ABC transporter permease [Oscillospiraceae bacterium]
MDILIQILWMFPVYAILGWCLEIIYCAVSTGKLVNRGFLGGPVCPIYGLGASIMILALTPVAHSFLAIFLGALLLGSLLELAAGFLLKSLFQIRWWDYTDEPFNIGGYISLKFSLIWGVIGIGLIRMIHPPIADLIAITPPVVLWTILTLFYAYFIVDAVVTVLTILKLNRDLKEITRLSALIHKGGETLAKSIGTPAMGAARKFEDTRVKLHEKLEDSERLNALLEHSGKIRRRLFKAFPNMNTVRNSNAFLEMRQRIINRVRKGK